MDGQRPRPPATRPLRRATATALALLALGGGLAACSDDPPPIASEDQYRETVTELCERHMPSLLDEWEGLRSNPFSDAELAAFYRSEMVPRVRSILRGARNTGTPQDADIQEAISDAAEALQEIEDDAAALIDRRRDGTFLDDENPWINLNAALATARMDCAIEVSNWVP